MANHSSVLELSVINPYPYSNTYLVKRGAITVYPQYTGENTEGNLGFTLVIHEAATLPFVEIQNPHSSLIPSIPGVEVSASPPAHCWESIRAIWRSMVSCLRPRPLQSPLHQLSILADIRTKEFQTIIPTELHQHFIIVTPPPLSMFPVRYSSSAHQQLIRIWRDPVATLGIIQIMKDSDVPEIRAPSPPKSLIGTQRAKPGDIIFIKRQAYYLIADIGELPQSSDYPEGTIAMEGRTSERTCVLIYIHRQYLVPPQYFDTVILPADDENDEESKEDEIKV